MTAKKGMEAYYLDQGKLNNGHKMMLFGKDGKQNGDFILIRSRWSNEVKKALEEAQRRINGLAWSQDIDEETETDIALEAMVSMVAGWSFGGELEENPSPEDIREFLERAPHIADRIDKVSGNTTLFFPDAEPNSSNGSKKN